MSCGLPAVATRNGGPSGSMQEDGRFFAEPVDPKNPVDIARGILAVIAPQDSWRRYRNAGKARVLAKHIWQKTADGYKQVFRSIIEAKHLPGNLVIPTWSAGPGPGVKPGPDDLGATYF